VNTITIITATAGGARIPGVALQIKTAGGVLAASLTTNSNGDGTAYLDNGIFTATGFKAMYNITPKTQSIAGAATLTVIGAAISDTAPSSGNQTAYLIPATLAMAIDTDAIITATPFDVNETMSPLAFSRKSTAVNTGTQFELTLAKGAHCIIEGKSGGKRFLYGIITVTNDDTKDLTTYSTLT
jgi:hypothetical protein